MRVSEKERAREIRLRFGWPRLGRLPIVSHVNILYLLFAATQYLPKDNQSYFLGLSLLILRISSARRQINLCDIFLNEFRDSRESKF